MTVHMRSMIAFIVVSITSLLPFSLFMNAHEYFYYKLRNVTEYPDAKEEDTMELMFAVHGLYKNRTGTDKTELQRLYEGWLNVTSGVACIFGSILNVVATNKLSNGFRVLTGHAIIILAFVPTVFYTFINTDADQIHFFWLSMMFASMASFGALGLVGGGICGLAATFPRVYMEAVMIAQSVSGIFGALLSIVCQATTENAILNGRIYFGLAMGWTSMSVLCYFWLVTSHYAKHQAVSADRHPLMSEEVEDDGRIETDAVEGMEGGEEEEVEIRSMHRYEERSTVEMYGAVLRKARTEVLMSSLILVTTIAVFPAVAANVQTEARNETWRAYFSSVCCFLLFNCCDMLGRLFASRMNIPLFLLVRLSWARTLLVPLILFCDVDPRFHTPTLIRQDHAWARTRPSDGAFVVFNALLGLSHGFCYTHATVKAISSVDVTLREATGGALAFVGVCSALLGSFVGIALVTVV